jgi:hypothetical protein
MRLPTKIVISWLFPAQALGISCRDDAEAHRVSPTIKQDYFTSQFS